MSGLRWVGAAGNEAGLSRPERASKLVLDRDIMGTEEISAPEPPATTAEGGEFV